MLHTIPDTQGKLVGPKDAEPSIPVVEEAKVRKQRQRERRLVKNRKTAAASRARAVATKKTLEAQEDLQAAKDVIVTLL
ncbi:hypothetical protein WJX72_003840 [[Myrmecia] bisecta]|uniref:BZIP domain-containing protein n=1 Tax=[Myrmecia] bisecta TaxID=41462 RepID=A0AAW1PC45_9CHLO